MRAEAAEHFHKLVEAAKEEGYEIVMTTAYRSYSFQKILWDNYVAREGEEAANRFSARPGQSEHQTGLAVDISSPSVNYALTEDFADTDEGIWIAENAHKFGFIIRFPKGKEHITGYLYEPWHLRYVGEKVATRIYEQELTLEEYLETP
jgi:D-alanyl-D-alanine carboxypeptidase